MERLVQQYLGSKGTDLDLKQQFVLYEVSRAPVGSGHVPWQRGGQAGEVAGVAMPDAMPTRPLHRVLSSWRMMWKSRPRGDARRGGWTRAGVGGDPRAAARSLAPMPSRCWSPLAP